MKTSRAFLLLSVVWPFQFSDSRAQQSSRDNEVSANLPPLTIVERGLNHRTVEYSVSPTASDGANTNTTIRYQELADCMHYLKGGQYLESKEEISVLPGGGALADKGQHQLYVPGSLYDDSLQLTMADSAVLATRPLGLAFADGQ